MFGFAAAFLPLVLHICSWKDGLLLKPLGVFSYRILCYFFKKSRRFIYYPSGFPVELLVIVFMIGFDEYFR